MAIQLHPSRKALNGLNGHNGKHSNGISLALPQKRGGGAKRRKIPLSTKVAALKEFADPRNDANVIAKKHGVEVSGIYDWSHSAAVLDAAGLKEKDLRHRRRKTLAKSKAPTPRGSKAGTTSFKSSAEHVQSRVGPVCFCPGCGCNIRNVAIAMTIPN